MDVNRYPLVSQAKYTPLKAFMGSLPRLRPIYSADYCAGYAQVGAVAGGVYPEVGERDLD